MDGIELIAAERKRQIEEEGFKPEDDALLYTSGQLVDAALCYLMPYDKVIWEMNWPWALEWWKPKDRLCNLVRAGALIAAEIDRITRLQDTKSEDVKQLTKGIEQFVNENGWPKFEELLQNELGLTLVSSEQGKRVYQTEDGHLKATIRELEIEVKK